jgi:hypothetical protein
MLFLFDHNDPLVSVFDKYRHIQENSGTRLSINYSKGYFAPEEQSVFSFYVNEIDSTEPSLFSTICKRDSWPSGVYRILNRTWQYPRVTRVEKTIHEGLYDMVEEQVKWCKQQPDFRAAIITRSRNVRLFERMRKDLLQRDLEFHYGGKVWVCSGSAEDCYQHVLYYGDDEIFKEWNTVCS